MLGVWRSIFTQLRPTEKKYGPYFGDYVLSDYLELVWLMGWAKKTYQKTMRKPLVPICRELLSMGRKPGDFIMRVILLWVGDLEHIRLPHFLLKRRYGKEEY